MGGDREGGGGRGPRPCYDFGRDDVAGTLVTREADRIAAALAALVAARPTVGQPLVTGFSQGGIMTFALAVTHPEAMAAAFPISGLLPPSLDPSTALSSPPRPATLPPVTAFHGAYDRVVPTQGARASIAELRLAGYTAELHEYPGLEHEPSDEEMGELLQRIGRAADSLAAAPAPLKADTLVDFSAVRGMGSLRQARSHHLSARSIAGRFKAGRGTMHRL